MKRLGYALLVLVVLAIPLYVWGFATCEDPEGQWPLDLAQLRKLAHEVPGALPTEVRVETVSVFEFPSAVMVTGSPWSLRGMTCFAYQLVYPDQTAVIDTAMDEKTARAEVPVKAYDAAAFARVLQALDVAAFSVVTHEHFDHMGGALVSAKGWKHLIANPQQLEHPELVKPLAYPGEKPVVVDYQGMKAVAPGVVLIRAPGHTPGSQMVYVQRKDGAELLFLGDVAWQNDNIDQVKERARVVTTLMHENRHDVLQQLAALHALRAAEPQVAIVPGHDGKAVEQLIAGGLLVRGFQVP